MILTVVELAKAESMESELKQEEEESVSEMKRNESTQWMNTHLFVAGGYNYSSESLRKTYLSFIGGEMDRDSFHEN